MRVHQGQVTLSDGSPLREDAPYRHGLFVFYRKEVPLEPAPIEEAAVVFRDDDIMVVDKPHGMPVTPAGDYVERSLLVRLQRMTALPDLSPLHRLDRETAGLVLFSINPASRGHYHRLFAEGTIEREYIATGHIETTSSECHWRVENRLESGEPWFRQQIVEGPVNAVTDIELTSRQRKFAKFRLMPKTGKKHQLRVHMASIGYPIAGDPFYPVIRKKREDEPGLQLLARRLSFVDPLSGAARDFTSRRALSGSFQEWS